MINITRRSLDAVDRYLVILQDVCSPLFLDGEQCNDIGILSLRLQRRLSEYLLNNAERTESYCIAKGTLLNPFSPCRDLSRRHDILAYRRQWTSENLFAFSDYCDRQLAATSVKPFAVLANELKRIAENGGFVWHKCIRDEANLQSLSQSWRQRIDRLRNDIPLQDYAD